MEARLSRLALLLAIVLLIRLPFLNHAIQGDDVYYLTAAQHAQIDPLHPNHVQYVFLGELVDLRGHPHPPLNAWVLALLLALIGDIREISFHAAYIAFSLIAVISMWSLARRFSPHPFWASLLFIATPAFVINGNSLESDLPFLAFWMASLAFFCAEKRILATLCMILAALAAYQAIFLVPILWVYLWVYRRKDRGAWAVTLIPAVTILAWQLFERFSTGALPAEVLSGYFQSYGLQTLHQKIRNAMGLTVHTSWLVFPLLLPPAIALSWRRRDRDTLFLVAWIAIFFGGALVVFYAGAARYLLPMAAPVALLVSRLRVRWLALGFTAHIALGLALAWVNYDHWDAYRRFAASLRQIENRRVWIDADLGLRYYLESDGGLPLQRGQAMYPGDLVVTSALTYPIDFNEPVAPVSETEIVPRLPLRLIGLNGRSGYSTASRGLLPFDVGWQPVDRVRAALVLERRPEREYLPMNAPDAAKHIVSGIYGLDPGANWRWSAGNAVVILKAPPVPQPLQALFTIFDPSPVRRVRMLLDGREVAAQTFSGPGKHRLVSEPVSVAGPSATVSLVLDQTFSVPGDRRKLGVILSAIGFRVE